MLNLSKLAIYIGRAVLHIATSMMTGKAGYSQAVYLISVDNMKDDSHHTQYHEISARQLPSPPANFVSTASDDREALERG